MSEQYFQGKERLEGFAPMGGRKMRMGAPAELRVSDRQRILDALKHESGASALEYLELINPEHRGMALVFTEWGLEWCQAMSKINASKERDTTKLAFKLWSGACTSIARNTGDEGKTGLSWLEQVFNPETCRPGASAELRAKAAQNQKTVQTPILEALEKRQQQIIEAVKAKRYVEAAKLFTAYWNCMLAVHDGGAQYSQSYPAAALQTCGQETAEKLIHDSFSSTSFFEPLWGFVSTLKQVDMAAFLAEHLRSHLSGEDRGGSTQVIEEEDRYRLVFDACGSGGAMRRRLQDAGQELETFPNASPATWMRKGEVSGYCSHCAYNEMQSMKRFGWLRLVTEFDADPKKPCGWTLYKSPNLIPEKYYTRLGMKKPAINS